MAGRGRGAGRGMSFNVESLGFGRGEALPGPILAPPPVFPPLDLKPVPLCSGEEYAYLLALKQEYRGTMRESPYYMKRPDRKKDIARYSDKYALGQHDNHTNWAPDWTRLPRELRRKMKVQAKVKAIIKPKLSAITKVKTEPEEDVIKSLEVLEKKEAEVEGKEEEEGEEDEEAELDEEDYYEEEDIEETDYNQTYFDNGENYGIDEEDDLDEGPIY